LILALVICAEYWTKALRGGARVDPGAAAALVLVTALALAAATGRARRWVFAGFAMLQLVYLWDNFPFAGNHRYLELVFALLFTLLDDSNVEERQLMLRSLRWIVVVVLFYSGLQKALHGYYFQGQFLAYALGRETFRSGLEPLLSSAEFVRLTGCGGEVGDGPYLVSSPLFLAVSNLVWIAEIGLAALLFPRVTRRYAWIAAVAFVAVTQVVAREFMFGVEFACAILLFARGDRVSRMVVPVAVFLALLLLVRLGILWDLVFH
jgi:hypothetical protein